WGGAPALRCGARGVGWSSPGTSSCGCGCDPGSSGVARSLWRPPSPCSSPGRRRPRAVRGQFAWRRATACLSGSCCTLQGRNASRSRGRSTNGTRTPHHWCGWEPAGSGRSRWRCPRGSTSTPSWWTAIAAVRALADQLGAASGALRSGGFDHPDADLVEGGAYALGAGLSVRQVQQLARASRPPYEPALTLRVAGTLAALGVPPKNSLDLVEALIDARRSPSDLLDLPSEVQAGVARGATPAQAAEGLARGAAHAPGSGPPGGVPPGQAKGRGNPHKP